LLKKEPIDFMRNREGRWRRERQRFLGNKKLAHVIVGSDKSGINRVGWQTGSTGKSRCYRLE
jgi:hypothetical protein